MGSPCFRPYRREHLLADIQPPPFYIYQQVIDQFRQHVTAV